MAGRGLRSQVESWSSPGGQRVLVVAPHPDDEVAGCAGAILEHRRAGDRVVVACATDGRRSRALGLEPERMAEVRRGEIEAAAGVLDFELEWLGLPEGEWSIEDMATALGEVLGRVRPHVVYAPSRIDFHPEHERVARALAVALTVADPRLEVRIYAIQVPLTPTLTNLVVPIDSSEPQLHRALRCYRSQLGALEPCLRQRRNAGRLYGLSGAEEIWRLPSAVYQRLHREPPSRPPGQIFRGLRYYAWSDPLAYLYGAGERRRLARLRSAP